MKAEVRQHLWQFLLLWRVKLGGSPPRATRRSTVHQLQRPVLFSLVWMHWSSSLRTSWPTAPALPGPASRHRSAPGRWSASMRTHRRRPRARLHRWAFPPQPWLLGCHRWPRALAAPSLCGLRRWRLSAGTLRPWQRGRRRLQWAWACAWMSWNSRWWQLPAHHCLPGQRPRPVWWHESWGSSRRRNRQLGRCPRQRGPAMLPLSIGSPRPPLRRPHSCVTFAWSSKGRSVRRPRVSELNSRQSSAVRLTDASPK
mmetsp:Transcript_102048/g.218514  ORF Transcript_102048/g.218514 Transcript_102048/m.218514 type:complete len:255 (+) Transcript_102048:463-1227(+)